MFGVSGRLGEPGPGVTVRPATSMHFALVGDGGGPVFDQRHPVALLGKSTMASPPLLGTGQLGPCYHIFTSMFRSTVIMRKHERLSPDSVCVLSVLDY